MLKQLADIDDLVFKKHQVMFLFFSVSLIVQSVIEYHVPKLARQEITGKDGGPVQVIASALDERL